MEPLVSIVVVNHNRKGLLRDCLESLVGQTWRNREVLVVDNGSSDGSQELVSCFEGEGVRLLPQERNLGFAAACNVGIAGARGELVALLNNDAVVEERWLEGLVGTIGESPAVGMVASKILLFDALQIDKVGHLIFPDGQNRGRGTGELDSGQFDEHEEALFPDGCAGLYRKAALDQVKGFDEDFFAYGDDADLGLRLQLQGWTCRYNPEAVARHHQSATAGVYSPRKIYWVERNRLWLAVKTFPLPLLLVTPALTMYRWLWNLLAVLLGKGAACSYTEENSFLSLLATLTRALRDGLLGLPRMWRKRRSIRSSRKIGDLEFYRLLHRFRISARHLAFDEPVRKLQGRR
jgi:GT2 family glycosyltransferase